MQPVVQEETLLDRYLPTAVRVIINLIVIAIFVVIIAKTLHDLPVIGS